MLLAKLLLVTALGSQWWVAPTSDGTTPVTYNDDVPLSFGTSGDCWWEWETATTPDRLELECTDIDGVGTNGPVCSVDQGTDDLVCVGNLTTVAGTVSAEQLTSTDDANVTGTCACGDVDTGDVALDTSTYTIPATLEPAGTEQTVTWGAATVQVLDLGSASGNVTLTWATATAGRQLWLRVIQSATARTITWPATVQWSYSSAPTLSTGNDEVDVIHCLADGSAEWCSVVGQDYD